MNEQCVMKNIVREACLYITVQVIETLKKTQRNLVPNLRRIKKMVELKKGRDGKKKTVTRIPVFSISGHQRASPSHFVRNFFAFILFFQSHIAENEAEMSLLLPVSGDFD